MWIFVCICIIKGNNNQNGVQVEVDAGAAATNEQVEEAAAAAAATPAAATDCPVSPASSSPPRTPPPNDAMEALLYAGRGLPPRRSTPAQPAEPISNTLPHVSGALGAFSPVTPPKGPPPPMTPNHVFMLKAAMNRPLGLVPQPSAKSGSSTLAASSSHTPMSPLPQPADASLGEAALDDAGGMDNATGDASGQMAIGTGAGVSDVEEANDQEAGVGNMDFGIGQQGDGRATMGSGSGFPSLGSVMGQQGFGQSTMGSGSGFPSLGSVMGQQGFGQSTMGVQSPWPPMAGCPLAPQPVGVFSHPSNYTAGLGGASASRTLPFPGFSPHPYIYAAGLGGASASRSLTYASAPPQGAAAAPPQGAAAAPPQGAATAPPQGAAASLHSDAWLKKSYIVPPNAFADTIEFINAEEHLTPTVPIAEIFAFAMLLRATYRDNFTPGVKLTPTLDFKEKVNNSRLFVLLQDPKPLGPFTGDQVCFLIAVRFICQSTSAATQLMGFLTNRDKGKIGMRVAKLFDPQRE